jgi:hypothetical protein
MDSVRTYRLIRLASLFSFSVGHGLYAETPTYTYTGNHFTNAVAPYTTSESITGYFTTSTPLTANLNAADISSSVQFFSFSAGQSTWTSINAG